MPAPKYIVQSLKQSLLFLKLEVETQPVLPDVLGVVLRVESDKPIGNHYIRERGGLLANDNFII